jgi:hypothetical protein
MLGRSTKGWPAVFHQLLIELCKFCRDLDRAVRNTDALFVTYAVSGGNDVARKTTCLIENRIDIVNFDSFIGAELENLVESCGVAKAEFDVVQRCVVVRHGYILRAINLVVEANNPRAVRISDIRGFRLYHKEVIRHPNTRLTLLSVADPDLVDSGRWSYGAL